MNRQRALVLGFVGIAGLLAWGRADAIPAFARKYQLSCSTCHAPFPRLKAFGEEFAGRGFRMDDPSKEPARATYDVGDPMLSLPRDLPLAIRIDGYASWKQDAVAETDVEWPWAFKILSGGPITKKISYYLYFLVEEGDTVGLEDIWVQFSSIFGAPVDIGVGQFQVCDPMFKRESRLERADYEVFKAHVGRAAVNLTYDRGVIAAWHAPWKLDAIVEVVNGNGIDPATDEQFDQDNYKNVALRLVRPFEDVRVGLFGYWGKGRAPDADGTGATNRTVYFGPDLVFDMGDKFALSLEYLERRDDDPDFVGPASPTFKTRGGFAELHFFPKGQDGRYALSALYNKITSDYDGAFENPDVESAFVTFNYLFARNVRGIVEAGRDLEADRTRVSFGLSTAF